MYEDCINCTKRRPACQSDCESYIRGKRAQQEKNDRINRAKQEERIGTNYIREHYNKTRRKK